MMILVEKCRGCPSSDETQQSRDTVKSPLQLLDIEFSSHINIRSLICSNVTELACSSCAGDRYRDLGYAAA